MPLPQVVAVAEHSPAERSGVWPGDELRSINGQVPRDVIEYQLLADEPIVELEVVRGGVELEVTVVKQAGEPLGLEISAAIFDRVRTCDNHCEFCFIYQLPKGMRRNLYVKDDDYRLSFLYGNFTTLTRFTEVDLERVGAGPPGRRPSRPPAGRCPPFCIFLPLRPPFPPKPHGENSPPGAKSGLQ